MASSFSVELHGLDQLRERLRGGRFLFQPTKQMIADLTRAGQQTAQRAAKPHPSDKGTLGRKLLIEFRDDGLEGRIFPHRSVAGLANVIEKGRKPGRRPPYRPLKRWAESHGIIAVRRGSSKDVRALQERIRAGGTKGVGFMRAGDEAIKHALRTRIPQTEHEIKQLWDRGG